MSFAENIITLRILLQDICDGFSLKDASKNTLLSTKLRILFMLKDKDLSPIELITQLGIAKSNLAGFVKKMIEDGEVMSYKVSASSKNIFYTITDKGRTEISEYISKLYTQIQTSFPQIVTEDMSKKLQEIIQLIKGNN